MYPTDFLLYYYYKCSKCGAENEVSHKDARRGGTRNCVICDNPFRVTPIKTKVVYTPIKESVNRELVWSLCKSYVSKDFFQSKFDEVAHKSSGESDCAKKIIALVKEV